jgi:LPS sulfotransferase NodH
MNVRSAIKHGITRCALEIRSLPGTLHYTRFVVVATARTGSTFLINLLNAHSQVLAFGELFRSPESIGWDVPPYAGFESKRQLSLYQSDPRGFLTEAVFRRWPRTCKAVGFKLFYYHAREMPYAMVWDRLAQDKEILVLHLKRRNILAQYVSLELAHKTNVWSAVSPCRERIEPIRLDSDACRRHFEWVRKLETECDAFFAHHLITTIHYEDLTAQLDAQMKRIQKVLGLREEKPRLSSVRQRTSPLSHAIANYSELKDTFADTPWAEFFTEIPA